MPQSISRQSPKESTLNHAHRACALECRRRVNHGERAKRRQRPGQASTSAAHPRGGTLSQRPVGRVGTPGPQRWYRGKPPGRDSHHRGSQRRKPHVVRAHQRGRGPIDLPILPRPARHHRGADARRIQRVSKPVRPQRPCMRSNAKLERMPQLTPKPKSRPAHERYRAPR